MKYRQSNSKFFVRNRTALAALLSPNSLVVVNCNDNLPSNGDGSLSLRTNSELFHLSGIEQEESILLLYPEAHEEPYREILFNRHVSPIAETWEGRKLTKEEARKISGVARVEWTSEFRKVFHRQMRECARVYLNGGEHKNRRGEVASREACFVSEARHRYPLHDHQPLAVVMEQLREQGKGSLSPLSGDGRNQRIEASKNPQYI